MTDEVNRSCNMYKAAEQNIQELQTTITQLQAANADAAQKQRVRDYSENGLISVVIITITKKTITKILFRQQLKWNIATVRI